jgi:hypothetical protein
MDPASGAEVANVLAIARDITVTTGVIFILFGSFRGWFRWNREVEYMQQAHDREVAGYKDAIKAKDDEIFEWKTEAIGLMRGSTEAISVATAAVRRRPVR